MGTATHATKADLDGVARTLARAFFDDPLQRWLMATAGDLEAAVTDFIGFFVRPYFDVGHTYVAARPGAVHAGAALWCPPDRRALHEGHIPELVAIGRRHLGDAALGKLAELGRFEEHLPPVPHFYLGILGVEPDLQSRGVGADLLVPGLRAADEGGFPCHLESSNPQNVPFYRRHGFEPVAELHPGGDGPLVTIMTRPPRRPDAA